MVNAPRDDNYVPVGLAVGSSSGSVPMPLEIDEGDGGLLVHATGGLIPKTYDFIAYTNTSATVDTYQYYSGGADGELVATMTITYTDSSKAQISTIART